jgi:hypothetical protein
MQAVPETIEMAIADIWIDAEKITWMRFKQTDRHSIEEAQQVVNAHNALANGVKTPVLADLREITTGADRQARQYYVSEESSRCKLGMAMLVSSPLQRMLGNLFMKLNSPPYPTRLFKEEVAALIWLRALQAQ